MADFEGGEGGNGGGQGGAADITGGAGAGGGDGGQGGTGGSGGAGGEGGGGQSGAGDADPDWFAQLSADAADDKDPSNRDWVKALGVKDLDGLTKIARDNQKALRDSGRVKVPGEGAPADEIAAFHKAIGVPEDVKGYALDPIANPGFNPEAAEGPDNLKDLPLNTALIDRLSAAAHKAGMPAEAFKSTVGEFIKAQLEEADATRTEHDAEATAQLKEWGADATAKLAQVDAAAKAWGLDKAQMQALRAAWGPKVALQKLAQLGENVGEGSGALLPGGGPERFAASAESAQKEIDAIKADPDRAKKVLVKGSAEEAQWNRLLGTVAAAEAARQGAQQ